MEFKVLTLNVKGLSPPQFYPNQPTQIEALHKLINPIAPDILCFTEVNSDQRKEIQDKFLYYDWEPDEGRVSGNVTSKYCVMIGIKSDNPFEIIDVWGLLENVGDEKYEKYKGDIEYLRVCCRLKANTSKTFSVIGIRMTTGGKNLSKRYDSEGKAFKGALLPILDNLAVRLSGEPCILMGDFNNARHLGSLKEKFDRNRYGKKPNEPCGCAQINYNLNLIVDWLCRDRNFEMADINGGKGFVTNPPSCNDHIFVRGLRVSKDKDSDRLRCNMIETRGLGLSDHNAIWAELEI